MKAVIHEANVARTSQPNIAPDANYARYNCRFS